MSDPLLDPPAWAPDWLPTIEDATAMRALRWVLWAVLVAGLGGCVLRGADQPADPELGAPTTVPLEGLAAQFGSVLVDLVTATGQALQLCLLDADEPAERAQGLMHVTDLEGFDGMLFTFEEPTAGQFYMYNTLVPLRIGWYDANGAWVAAADMVPCESDDPAACQRYPAGAPFLYGIEVTADSPHTPHLLEGTSISPRGEACEPLSS